ncbi:FAD-dependent oxidoreductase [Rhodococcus sp. NPDC058521]|uniref:FAD-dependent oxidoreductase n=1 Tax=Rhodococcus sp. NPDC058521 TaxID=3346536 RepID=UPI00365F0B8C
MSESSPVHPRSANTIATWDREADVVVAGYGIAGVTAAIESARAGAEVLVLERTSGWGGAAALAGGFVYLGGGTPLQTACGFEDSPENMRKFMMAALGPGADEEKITDYCNGSVEHYNWLVDCGVPFKATFWSEPGWEPPFDDGLMYSGGENAAPFDEIATPAPRGHVPQMENKRTGEKGGGYMLMQPLVDTAEKLGVKAEYDVRVQTLVTDEHGRVVGIVAKRYGKEIAVKARRGVVLATGSFAYNDRMIESYAPRMIGRPGAAIEEHDGRSIRMAQALGADLAHMDATEVAFLCDPQLMVRGILVNGRGQRYIAEDTYSGRIGQATLFRQDNQAYLVIDEAAYEEGAAGTSSTPFLRQRPKWVAETVEELEADMGLPAGSLQATVEVYNKHAAESADPLLRKKPEWVKPIGTPVAAVDLRGMTLGFTLGGLRTTIDSEVLHVSGEPIAGLYAAGRCTSGVCAGGYASGTSLGDGSFYGRRAGISAAKNTPQ